MLRVLIFIIFAQAINAVEQLPPGYIRGECTHRVILENATENTDKVLKEWYVLTDIRQHVHYKELETEAQESKIWEYRDAHPGANMMVEQTRLFNTTWVPLYRVIIALDPHADGYDGLVTPASQNELAKTLTDFFKEYPQGALFGDKKTKGLLLQSWSWRPDGFYDTNHNLRMDHIEVCAYPLIPVDKIVREWQANNGAPYHEPRDVIMHIWTFRDYIDHEEVPAFLTKTAKEFDQSNKVPNGPHYELINLSGIEPKP